MKIFVLILFLTSTLMSGGIIDFLFGNEKLDHYNGGGKLTCKIDKWFSKDIIRTIDKDNSTYEHEKVSTRGFGHPEGFEYNDLFFDIDDCVISED